MICHFPCFAQALLTVAVLIYFYSNEPQTYPLSVIMWSCIPHVSKISTLTYTQVNSVVIHVLILNIMHNIFHLRGKLITK